MPGPVPALSARYLVACPSDWRQRLVESGPKPARHARARGKSASSPRSPSAPSEDSSGTPPSPTLRVSPGPPELERTPAPHPGQFVLLNPATDRCGFATGSLHSCGRRLFLASFLYRFPASLSASLWPLHFTSFVLGTLPAWLLALTRNCEFPTLGAFPVLKTEIV